MALHISKRVLLKLKYNLNKNKPIYIFYPITWLGINRRAAILTDTESRKHTPDHSLVYHWAVKTLAHSLLPLGKRAAPSWNATNTADTQTVHITCWHLL